jgi:flagellar P-ring protein precursor FlgI
MTRVRFPFPILMSVALALATLASGSDAQTTVGSITTTEGNVSVRLMGFGLVIGLDGTGDRNLVGAGRSGGTSARAVANLLQRFGMSVDDDLLRVRNVAAVIVQADVDPYLRAGQRFDLQVSSLHDATSLSGGQLLMMPLLMDLSDTLMAATGSGGVIVQQDPAGRILRRGGSSGRVPQGGLVEVDLPRPQVSATPVLSLNSPDVTMASRIAGVINGAIGDGTATILDPGSIQLNPPTGAADNLIEFLAGIDTLTVAAYGAPRIIINRHDGTVATVGTIMLGQTTTITHAGITLTIGGSDPGAPPVAGLVRMPVGVPVQDIAAGLHAAGASPHEVATMFELLKKAGVIAADIEVQ